MIGNKKNRGKKVKHIILPFKRRNIMLFKYTVIEPLPNSIFPGLRINSSRYATGSLDNCSKEQIGNDYYSENSKRGLAGKRY